ncbi:MAG: efflux RND transporter periplasmic adaptor subunit [Gammaproteobacteria bacterium]|nr:efflux RND transporter periplasmic adaptor subunit [Gammaproteobacteria bacterium]
MLALSGVVVVAILLYQLSQQSEALPAGLIQTNGRIEGDTVIIASKQPGRIVDVMTREGDTVEKSDVLVRLDDRVAHARVNQAKAAAAAAKANAEQCQADLALLGKEVPLRIGAAEAGVDAANAVLLQAEAQEKQTQRDFKRYWELATDGSASQEIAEKAQTQWKQARDQVVVARAALMKARQDQNDAGLGPDRIYSKEAQVAAFQAAAEEAQARVEEAETVLEELTISSPAAGTITTRLADLGEVINAGAPLFELVNLDDLYLKVFIPEVQIGKVRRGLEAQIYTDAFPDQAFVAEVRYIASRAEFTPKEIQTPDERVKLVYAVKLYLKENPDHRLTPGLPADAMIRWQSEVPWAKPRW